MIFKFGKMLYAHPSESMYQYAAYFPTHDDLLEYDSIIGDLAVSRGPGLKDEKPTEVDQQKELMNKIRQEYCNHIMIKGQCDTIARCVHCGISQSELEARNRP